MDVVEKLEADIRALLEPLSSPIERHTKLAGIMAGFVRPGPDTDIYGSERRRFNIMATAYAPAVDEMFGRLVKDFG